MPASCGCRKTFQTQRASRLRHQRFMDHVFCMTPCLSEPTTRRWPVLASQCHVFSPINGPLPARAQYFHLFRPQPRPCQPWGCTSRRAVVRSIQMHLPTALILAMAAAWVALLAPPAAALHEDDHTSGVVGVGRTFSCAITTKGQLKCWGGSNSGAAPLPVPALPTGRTWVAVAAAGEGDTVVPPGQPRGHACGIDSAGRLLCWGNNAHGQISVPGLLTGLTWTSVAAGPLNSCATTSTGRLKCWGDSAFNQSQVPTLPGGAGWRQVACSASVVCGVTNADTVVSCLVCP